MGLAGRTAPIPRARHRLPRGIPLLRTSLPRRRRRKESWKHYAAIVFWTVVVLGGWSLWNHVVWGWW